MLAFLSVNSTYRGPYSEGSALCLAFALASPTGATMSKVKGGIGTLSDHLAGLFEQHGGELRRHVKVAGIATEAGRVVGVRLADGETVSAPVVVSNLDPTTTFTQLLDRDDPARRLPPTGRRHRPPCRCTSRCTSPWTACPSRPAPTRS